MRRVMKACGVDLQPPRLPTSITRACGECSSAPRCTRSSTSTTSAAPRTRTAFNVKSSGSPGPAPTRYTLPGNGLSSGEARLGCRCGSRSRDAIGRDEITPGDEHRSADDIAQRDPEHVVSKTRDRDGFRMIAEHCHRQYGHVGDRVLEAAGDE